MRAPKESTITTTTFSPISPPPNPPTTLPTTTQPPLIYHVTAQSGVPSQTTLQSFLHQHTGLSPEILTSLTELGSVYMHHTPSPRRSPRAERQRISALLRPLPSGRLYCRVHAHPKRYSWPYEPCVMWENAGVLVVDKPPGLPVCAGVDNCVECVTKIVNARVTTRLDVGTSGVLVMARTPAAARIANCAVKEGNKFYVVFVRGRGVLKKGVWEDWYNGKARLGRGVREGVLKRWEDGPLDGWIDARLEIVDVWDGTFGDDGFVVVVKLLTGRTHQIRLQFCARGWVVIGDAKYERIAGRVYDGGFVGGDATLLGLHCWKIALPSGECFTSDIEKRADLMAPITKRDEFMAWLKHVAEGL